MDIATLGLEIRSDGVVVATDRLRGLEGQSGRTERSVDGLSRAFRLLAPVVGALGAAFSVRSLIQYGDAWSDMQSRVGAAIKDMEAAPTMMRRIVDIANASYSPLEQTVEIYSRNVSILADLGRGASEAADFTEALNHALVITATRGQRAESVQNALSKAMAVGRLQAEGLETILANGGRVAEVLADELGTSVSGLRELASQGRITGEVIASALISRVKELGEQAGEMDATVADAVVRMQTNFGALVGRVDQAVGATQSLASGLIGLADGIMHATEPAIAVAVALSDNFERLAFWAGAFAVVMAGQYVASVGAATVATGALSTALGVLRWALIRTGIGALIVLLGEVVFRIYEAATATEELGDALEDVTRPANNLFTFLQNGAEATYATFEWMAAGIAALFVGAFATIYEQYARLVNLIVEGLNKIPGVDVSGARMNETWATEIYNDLLHSATDAGRNAARLWAQAFGANLNDDLGNMPAFSELESFLSRSPGRVAEIPPVLGDIAAGAAAANDNLGHTTDLLDHMGQTGQQALSTLASGFTEIFKSIITGSGNAMEAVGRLLDRLGDMFLNNAFQMLVGGLFGGGMSSLGSGWGVPGGFAGFPGIFGVPGFANGTSNHPGGWSWIGERGPELVRLPRGSQVMPHHQSMAFANQNQHNDNAPPNIVINNTIHANSEADGRAAARGFSEGMRQWIDSGEGHAFVRKVIGKPGRAN